MLGAIAGDVIGHPFERSGKKVMDFPLFIPRSRPTDDSVLTVATAEALLGDGDYQAAYRAWGRRYPHAGYGRAFKGWLWSTAAESGPYNSFGNGSAMRVSPVAWLRTSLEEVITEAERTALPTHDHPEGIKGAQAVAVAVFLARTGASKETIRSEVERRFGYDLSSTVEAIRPGYRFDVTCQGSVPQSLLAFLDSTDWEDSVRLAVSLGGDADTQASIAGAVAEGFYGGVPPAIWAEVERRLPVEMLEVITRFAEYQGLATS